MIKIGQEKREGIEAVYYRVKSVEEISHDTLGYEITLESDLPRLTDENDMPFEIVCRTENRDVALAMKYMETPIKIISHRKR